MTDETPAPAAKTSPSTKAEGVEATEPAVAEQPRAESEESSQTEPVAATSGSAEAESALPAQQVVYVTAQQHPKKKGNRGVGSAIALAAALLFTALLAFVTAAIRVAGGGRVSFAFLAEAQFYIPVLFFVIGFVLLVLILNRAGWWAYIVGSLLLAVLVYFGTIALGLLSTGIILNTPDEAAARYAAALRDPFVIASALLAREVSIWVGAAISMRGRRVKARNVEARDAFDREQTETRAHNERGTLATPPAA